VVNNNGLDLSHLERGRFSPPSNLLQPFSAALQSGDLIEQIRQRSEIEAVPLRWEHCRIAPDTAELDRNIRAFNFDHVLQVGLSILEQGQLQPCIAEPIMVEGEIRGVKVVAGQHRAIGVNLMSQLLEVAGISGEIDLMVRLSNRELTQREKLEIQIAENLQNPMTPDEEAEAIAQLWGEFRSVHGEGASKAQLARSIGRTPAKVYNALNFAQLPAEVKGMVASKILPYGTALELSRLHRDKLERIDPKTQDQIPQIEQDLIRTAVHIVSRNMDMPTARTHIASLINPEGQFQLGLFSGEVMASIKREDIRLGIKTAVDRAFADSVGYFIRIREIIRKADVDERVFITDALLRHIAEAMISNNAFLQAIAAQEPKIAQDLMERIGSYVKIQEV
jgi:ParB-like chromosome segregation protein Spo0J